MYYVSSRNKSIRVSASYAITHGIAEDGGLFIPESIPVLSSTDFSKLCSMSYIDRAAFILKKYLTDFSDSEIEYCVRNAYTGSFENDIPAPAVPLYDNISLLELWHGPTCAFKDLALQLLPYLMTTAAKHEADGKKIVIPVATSGDTGKAALEGFKNVKDTEMIVFYPSDGVSAMQKLQMTSQDGENVHVFGITGNFDDAQTAVKKAFTNKNVIDKLAAGGFEFSSANSINWGRLVPQIVYYVSVYCDMINAGIDLSDGFDVSVPTGNFGNILAAYFAKLMGAPIKKLVCASNRNKILTDFINTGVYNKNRDFYTTVSPSMDILVSSNLERMLYLLSGDDRYVAKLQAKLSSEGCFEVKEDIKQKFSDIFYAGYADDERTAKTISDIYTQTGYVCDTHTAVGLAVALDYGSETGMRRPMIVASTASPYKFSKSVLSAIGDSVPEDEFESLETLSKITGLRIPAPISALREKKRRFTKTIDKTGIEDAIFESLDL